MQNHIKYPGCIIAMTTPFIIWYFKFIALNYSKYSSNSFSATYVPHDDFYRATLAVNITTILLTYNLIEQP